MCNVACDVIKASTSHNSASQTFSLLVPQSLRLLPIHMLAMMKSVDETDKTPAYDARSFV